jgi:hypothetical protein
MASVVCSRKVGEREADILQQLLCFQSTLILKLRVELFLGRKNPVFRMSLSSGKEGGEHQHPNESLLLDQHSANGMMGEAGSANRKQKKDIPSVSITKLSSTNVPCA